MNYYVVIVKWGISDTDIPEERTYYQKSFYLVAGSYEQAIEVVLVEKLKLLSKDYLDLEEGYEIQPLGRGHPVREFRMVGSETVGGYVVKCPG